LKSNDYTDKNSSSIFISLEITLQSGIYSDASSIRVF